MKKIGIFLSVDPAAAGGLEAYTRTLCDGLIKRDFDVRLNGHSVEASHDISTVWAKRRKLLLPLMTRPRLLRAAEAVTTIWGRRWCDKAVSGCDHVHYVGTGWDLLGFPLSDRCREHGVSFSCWPAIHPGQWGDSPLDLLFYRRANKIFAQSDFEASHLLGLGIDPSLIERVGCAASIPFQGQGAKLTATHDIKNRFRILFIGRKSRSKGYFNLRRAIANLICRFPHVVLISIGNRVENEEVPLPSSVDIDLGCAEEEVKQNALAACDILCVPSSHESFGIVYTEAWGYGKPVICGAAPASQELVKNHGGGIVTDGSVDAIEKAIIRLISNPQEAREMGRRGKVAQDTHFNPDSIVERHINSWQLVGPGF